MTSRPSTLRLSAALRYAAREQGGPLPSTDVAEALLDEPRMLMGDLNYRQMISGEYGALVPVFVL